MASAAPHLEAFLDAARYFIGMEESGSNTFTDPRGAEMFAIYGGGRGSAWCAIFVSVCAIKADIAGVIIDTDSGVGGVTKGSILYYDAEWIDGPYHTNSAVTPIPGDLITFVGDPAWKYSSWDHAGHIGIVEYVDDEGVHTIEGNSSDACRRNVYALDYSQINGYCRQDWSAVGDNVTAYLEQAGVSTVKGPLYQNKNDRHDMTIRQVGYLDNNYQLSNSASDINISIINYTTLLGEIYDVFAAYSGYKISVDTTQLSGNVKIAMDYFLDMGFSASAASAITGCLKRFSNVMPDYNQLITTIKNEAYRLRGIAAWNNEKTKLVEARLGGYGWNTNLSGQLNYLVDELNKDYADLVKIIKSAPLNIVSVDQVVVLFIRNYNDYFGETAISDAKKYAEEIYNKLIITKTSLVGSVNNLRDESGNLLTAQFSVDIPSYVDQTGIIGDFTSYSYWYHGWGAGTVQRELANIWAYYGCAYENSIALIGGYYCVAVTETFGTEGDVIVVTLANGDQFAAIIADTKNSKDRNFTEWGHEEQDSGKYQGKIKVIEWERVITDDNGKVRTEDVPIDIVESIDLGSWFEQNVVNITNYGSYLT